MNVAAELVLHKKYLVALAVNGAADFQNLRLLAYSLGWGRGGCFLRFRTAADPGWNRDGGRDGWTLPQA
jgi:hypothetical protein